MTQIVSCACNAAAHRRVCNDACVDRADRYATLAADRGWKPVEARRCPRTLTGKRCTARTRVPCLCSEWRNRFGGLVLDHLLIWSVKVDGERRLVLTSEPYARLDDERIAAFVAQAQLDGFQVQVSDDAAHFEGTILLEITWEPH